MNDITWSRHFWEATTMFEIKPKMSHFKIIETNVSTIWQKSANCSENKCDLKLAKIVSSIWQ